MDKIEIKVFISRLTTLKWRLRHNACYILAYVLILLAGLSMAVFMGISSGNKAGLSDGGWSVLGGFFIALIVVFGCSMGWLAVLCWTYGIYVFETQTIAIDKAKMSIAVDSNDGKGDSISKTMQISFVKEKNDYFQIGKKSSKFFYIPKNQITQEQSSFIRSLIISKTN